MADYKVIMTLAIAGHSYDEIVAAAGCSRREVASVKKTIAAYGFTAGQVGSMTPAEIAALFPDGRKRVSEDYAQPDFGPVLAAMKANRHFTIQQAWGKYLASETGGGGKKYGYSQYCALLAEHARVKAVVATLRHEPGRAMLVDCYPSVGGERSTARRCNRRNGAHEHATGIFLGTRKPWRRGAGPEPRPNDASKPNCVIGRTRVGKTSPATCACLPLEICGWRRSVRAD